MEKIGTSYPEAKHTETISKAAVYLVNSAIVLVLMVVLMGGWTRINDAGLSCPDWPGCFGQLTVPQSDAQLLSAEMLYPNIEVQPTKSWLEMIHRYLAATLSMLILGLVYIAILMRKNPHYPCLLSYSLLALVGLQAMLGMWTVTLKLLPIVVTTHLLGGLLTTVLLLILRHKIVTDNSQPIQWQRANTAALIGLLILFLQILLGGWTSSNYAGWGCGDWLGCNPNLNIQYNFSQAFTVSLDATYTHQGGRLPLSARGAIQISHKIGALVVLVYFVGLYCWLLKTHRQSKLISSLVGLTLLQIVLGLLNIVFAIPTLLAMAHHLVAVVMLIVTTKLWLASFDPKKST